MPDAGGLLDQEYALLDRMNFAYNCYLGAYACRQGTEVKDLGAWSEANPQLFELYTWIMEIRRDGNRDNPNTD